MMPASLINNLASWTVQVLILGSAGAVLPAILRLRHPRSQLIYCHLVLVACLVLPLIQPWQHPVSVVQRGSAAGARISTAEVHSNSPSVALPASVSWVTMLAGILFAGMAAKFCWMCAGLLQLRRYRNTARPLHPVPASIVSARSMIKADAAFCMAESGAGPVTFGFLRPVVLLPETFLELEEEAQRGIVCHELLHVRRKDWLSTLIEEIIGAVFWFHPAIWWVLGQTRLAREQLVDAEVVRLTSAREPYINALLAIAGARPRLDLAPAPLFLRRRHLLQRMHSLAMEVSMSRLRLFSSYAVMALILALAGWMVFVSFPLVGQAEVRYAPAQARAEQTPPGYVVNIRAVPPPEAVLKRVEGQVVVELTFNANGNIVDSRVLSGPEELRREGLATALRNNYNIDVARTLQVVVDFKLSAAAAGQRGGGQRGAFGVVGGTLPSATPSIDAPPPPPPPPPPGAPFPPRIFDNAGNLESINIYGLSEPELTSLRQRIQGFVGRPMTQDLMQEIMKAIRSGNGSGLPPNAFNLVPTPTRNSALTLTFGGTAITRTPFGDRPATGQDSSSVQRVRVGGNVMAANLLQKTDPQYPPLARQARIQGVVVLEAQINKEGTVENLNVVTGHPLLIQAATDAVKQWVYKPVMLNGAPVDVVTSITVNFVLPPEQK